MIWALSRALRGTSLLILVTLTAALLALGALAGCGGEDEDPDKLLEQAQRAVEEANSGLINQSFTVTADSLYYPFDSMNDSFAPEAGNQYVLVQITVSNTGEYPVVASYADFSLEASDGVRYPAALVPGLEDDFGAARSPIPGSEESGTLAFEIPTTVTPVALWEEIGPESRPVSLPAPA